MLPPGSFSLATFWFDIHERSEKEPFKPPTNHPTHRDANAVRSLQLSRTHQNRHATRPELIAPGTPSLSRHRPRRADKFTDAL
jgi:hypothetical protein